MMGTTMISAGFLLFLAGRLLGGNVAESAPVLIGTSVVGLISGTALWLAFLPPENYVRRIRARVASSA